MDMDDEMIVSTRPDRELWKKRIKAGDFSIVPYEEAKCKVIVSDVRCYNDAGDLVIDPECRVFHPSFDGSILIGDYDCYLDRDFELLLQRMCDKEVCQARMTYKDHEGKLAMEITCKIELVETMEEQLISDWSWQRLYETSLYHKEKGVELAKVKKTMEAFKRFSRSLKFLVAIDPVDPEVIPEDMIKTFIESKIKLYNNLAHCQLYYKQYEATVELCNRALKYDPANIKSLYRRCLAYEGLNLVEQAWADIQEVIKLDPSDKIAQRKAKLLQPKMELINKNYQSVIKKMFE